MAITDLITISLSIFFLIRGASRGFLNSLLGPFSMIAATFLSIIYYQSTNNLVISLVIGLIGPLILNFSLKFLLGTWAEATDGDVKPNFLSRLGGSILTLIWGWVFIVFTLILLALLPPLEKTLAAVHGDVTRSISYSLARPLGDIFFAGPRQNVPVATSTTATNDAKSLAEDPRFQRVLQDPEVQKEVNAHDIFKLMGNPKMMALTQQIMSDPATMKKVLAIYSNNQKILNK